jgi:hypothetical protein
MPSVRKNEPPSSPELHGGGLSDATTEVDDDDTGPTDLSHLADRAEFLALMARNPTQGPSMAELRRRQKYIDDPDATESDSDGPLGISEGPVISGQTTSSGTGGIIEVLSPFLLGQALIILRRPSNLNLCSSPSAPHRTLAPMF